MHDMCATDDANKRACSLQAREGALGFKNIFAPFYAAPQSAEGGTLKQLVQNKKKRSNHDGYGERTIGAERLAFLLVYACRGSRLTFPPGN
jgi:hypothetical protein